jgi:D,D-heptose 1,7-bisphosphate phosphatase
MAMTRRAVFIDKDGTLIEDRPYNVDPTKVVFTTGAIEGLRLLTDAGFALIVVSNQSGIARGYFEAEAVESLFRHIRSALAAKGVYLLDSYYCPHYAAGSVAEYARACDCRKPLPGMLSRAAQDNGLELCASYMIGDILDDVEAGHSAGCRSVLLDRGSETEWRKGPGRIPDFTTGDFLEAARWTVADANTALLQGAVRDVA